MSNKEIKVGQVWQPNYKENKKFVITALNPKFGVNVVYNDGNVELFKKEWISKSDVVRNCILLATYKHWQEAVNSKEFKGE